MTARSGKRAIAGAAALLMISLPAGAQEWSVSWWSLDSGGVHVVQGDDWTLSGTVGQADATAAHALDGGVWQVTGGFWALASAATDYQFSSGFEG